MKEEFIKELENWLRKQPDNAFKKTILPIIRYFCESNLEADKIDTTTPLGRLSYYIKSALDEYESEMLGNEPKTIKFLPDRKC